MLPSALCGRCHPALAYMLPSPSPRTCCCSVAWTAGGVLRKQLTTPAPVLAAAWCHFQNTGPDPILCLLHSGSLGVYTQDGDCHAVPLPGAFTGLWPLPQGVLLTVRKLWGWEVCWPMHVMLSDAKHHGMWCSGHCAARPAWRAAAPKSSAMLMPDMLQGAAAHGPCILVHPLEAVQEVEMAGGSSAAGGWDEEERVVW